MYEQAVVLMCISTMGLGMQRTSHTAVHTCTCTIIDIHVHSWLTLCVGSKVMVVGG